jgi:glutathione S-transferase
MSRLLLYGNRLSGHSYKVRLALMLGDQSHDYEHVDLALARDARPDDFRAASRWGEVPVLLVDGVPLVQSNAILQWLAESEGVLAAAPGERQMVREWLSWEANRIGISLPNLRYVRLFGGANESVCDWLSARLRDDLSVLDATLAERDWLVGQHATIADIACAAYLWWLPDAGLNLQRWPNVAAWLARIETLPGWAHPDTLMAPDLGDEDGAA